ncbi:MAG TPA: DUF4232 domain-containing protein [Gaiellaceae bacterium]
MQRVALIAVAALAVTAAAAQAAPRTTQCRGAQLAGTFRVVRGSAGAGNITYRLVMKNVSTSMCTLSGLPAGRLLDRSGKPLPTHVIAAFPGALAAILVRLKPGASTHADARFSPDVPGPGEPTAGLKCERTAYWFRVAAPGGGTTKVKVSPPTPVCEHGQLRFSAYSL